MQDRYFKVSEYYKNKYGEKAYKIPISLPVTCPHRINGSGGCIFCSEVGVGFEILDSKVDIISQLNLSIPKIKKKYGAKKFIAYFQNFTPTYAPSKNVLNWSRQALSHSEVVELAISTRPDTLSIELLEDLLCLQNEIGKEISFELGLQSISDDTLANINRGHTVKDFEDAVSLLSSYGFSIGVHIIGNLPWDDMDNFPKVADYLNKLPITSVKVHTLFIPKNTVIADLFVNKKIEIVDYERYLDNLVLFVRRLSKEIVIQRLFARAPDNEVLFENWGFSWRKLQNMFEEIMENKDYRQGDLCTILMNGQKY